MNSTTTLVGRILLTLLFSYFTFRLLTMEQPWIFIDGANLLIHEAGHLLFIAFGQFIYMVGGSLTQILIPCLFFTYFLLKKEYFSTAAVLFWIGNNFINIAVYMKDAILMQLPLLGGASIHDWNWIFGQLNILHYSESIGNFFFSLGALYTIVSIVGMTFFTIIQKDNNRKFS